MSQNSFQNFTIRIAGIEIRINALYSQTYFLCYEYLSESEPDFEVTITPEDLINEQAYAVEDGFQNKPWQMEAFAVYRKIVEKIIDYNAIMLHGAAIALHDAAFIFTGKSGIGKTTHIRKWLENNPEVIVVNGDKPILRYMDGSFFACGTPWAGKERMNTNTMIRLKSIAFMTRSEDNAIKEIDYSQAFPRLLNQMYLPKDLKKMQKTLDLLERMKDQVRFFDFHSNNMKEDSYATSYQAIVGS